MTSRQASDARVRVKVCGLTRAEDARAAAALGADAVGVIFYTPSPRAVGVEQARAVLSALPPFVTAVGVFVDPEPGEVEEVLRRVPLDMVQFHGAEDPQLCATVGRPYIKALGMRVGVDVRAQARRFDGARGLLLDTFSARAKGGTGRAFDWSTVPVDLPLPVILAGGLGPDNVAAAIRAVRPYAVDTAGGVESAPGIKDAGKIEAFIREVKRVEAA